MSRYDLTDEQWQRLQPLLPKHQTEGRPRIDDRRIVNGIRWILRTGAPWRDLPERYGSWHTVYSRFYRWQQAGHWDRILKILQEEADAQDQLQWEIHFVDSTIVRAHQHAAGAKKGTQPEKLSAAAKAVLARKSTSGPRGTVSR
jgi:transposase